MQTSGQLLLALSRHQDADRVVVAHQAVMVCRGNYGGLGVALQGSYGVGHVLKIDQGDCRVTLREPE